MDFRVHKFVKEESESEEEIQTEFHLSPSFNAGQLIWRRMYM